MPEGTVLHHGVWMSGDEKAVLEHVRDRMQDHYGSSGKPNIRVKIDYPLINLGHDPKYRCKADVEDADRWYSKVNVNYTIGSKVITSPVLAFDEIYFDLTNKTCYDNTPITNYNKTWTNVYIPEEFFKSFCDDFRRDTGWDVSAQNITHDATQGLYSLAVNLDANEPPYFTVVANRKECDDDDDAEIFTGPPVLQRLGSVQSIAQEYACIDKGTGFFTVSMHVMTPVGQRSAPTNNGTFTARIKLSLMGTCIVGCSKIVQSISIGGRKTKDVWG
jgi:hypothetical protein